MTENEAKNKLDSLHHRILNTSFCNKVYESEVEALCMAKDVLEEIQQYRAIGTVRQVQDFIADWRKYKEFGTLEDIQTMKDNGSFSGVELAQIAAMQMRLKDYEAIGTVEEFKALKDIDEDLRLKYCYEDLSSAELRGYCQGSDEAVDNFAKFLHDKAKENNGLRLSSETRSRTQPNIFDYLEEFKNEQICKEEIDCECEV